MILTVPRIAGTIGGLLLTGVALVGQTSTGTQLADLVTLRSRIGNSDTRTRVDAFHRVWAIGLASSESSVKTSALDLLTEPAGSASDHIRMPAVYAIAEIAGSTDDPQVKLRAIRALSEPLDASQVPIRVSAIDALNIITSGTDSADVILSAVNALGPTVRSGTNGVRIPAINALIRAISGRHNDRADQAVIDLLMGPLDSGAVIGGMEVRMMAVAALERAGLDAPEVGTKAKAMGLLQVYAGRNGWEPEARKRAQDAATAVQNSMKQ